MIGNCTQAQSALTMQDMAGKQLACEFADTAEIPAESQEPRVNQKERAEALVRFQARMKLAATTRARLQKATQNRG